MKQKISSKEWVFRVQDILQAIVKIERYVDDMTLAKFKQNQLVIDAEVRSYRDYRREAEVSLFCSTFST